MEDEIKGSLKEKKLEMEECRNGRILNYNYRIKVSCMFNRINAYVVLAPVSFYMKYFLFLRTQNMRELQCRLQTALLKKRFYCSRKVPMLRFLVVISAYFGEATFISWPGNRF
jgi:hypothetical protein